MAKNIRIGGRAIFKDPHFPYSKHKGIIAATAGTLVLFVFDDRAADISVYMWLSKYFIDIYKTEQETHLCSNIDNYLNTRCIWEHESLFHMIRPKIVSPGALCSNCKLQMIHSYKSLCECCDLIKQIEKLC